MLFRSNYPPTAHTHNASDINAGTLAEARIPNLNMLKITAGNLLTNRLQEPTAMNAGATPTQRALLNVTRANRAAFMPAEDILVELSTDGGQSWTIQSLTDAQKRGLFSQNREFTLNFPTPRSTNNKIRITIDPKTTNISGARYAQVNQLYWWCGANGDRMSVVVERSTVGAPNTFSIAYNGSDLFSGWTGMAMVNFSTGTFGGDNTQTSNFQKYRFTFSTALVPGESNLLYTGAQSVTDIRLYGDNAWTSPNPMMNIDSLFSWDSLQNANFPAEIREIGQRVYSPNNKPNWVDIQSKPALEPERTLATFVEMQEGTLDTIKSVNPRRVKEATGYRTISQGSNKTLAIGDAYQMLLCTAGTGTTTITIPTHASVAFNVDTEITICRYGAGEVEISPASGVTIVSHGGNRKINEQYQVITIKKVNTNVWLLVGALKS